jgi:hypothetical protein
MIVKDICLINNRVIFKGFLSKIIVSLVCVHASYATKIFIRKRLMCGEAAVVNRIKTIYHKSW